MKTIYVVGSINTDMSIAAPYLPQKGETLTGGGFITARGGKGANQAVAAARLEGKVVMCGCVGEDAFGREAISSFAEEGIDVRFVREVKNTPTGTAVILVISGDNRIILDRGANACLSKEDVKRALENAKAGDILLTQLENPIETVAFALTLAREKGMYTVLNPAPADVAVKKYLSLCDLVIPNETEAEILGGRETLAGEIEDLLVTVGKDGSEYYHAGKKTSFLSMPVDVVDTTGAGDTFCGALCVKLSEGETIEKAIEFATAASALACTKKGAQPAIPKREDVERFLKS